MPPRSEKPNSKTEPASAGETTAPLTTKSFEKGVEELEEIVRELERGELSLEDSILLFGKGMELSNACRQQLDNAETRVEMLTRKGGKMQTEPFVTENAPGTAGSLTNPISKSVAPAPPTDTSDGTSDDDDIPF